MALASVPLTELANNQFLRPTTNGRITFSARLLSTGICHPQGNGKDRYFHSDSTEQAKLLQTFVWHVPSNRNGWCLSAYCSRRIRRRQDIRNKHREIFLRYLCFSWVCIQIAVSSEWMTVYVRNSSFIRFQHIFTS